MGKIEKTQAQVEEQTAIEATTEEMKEVPKEESMQDEEPKAKEPIWKKATGVVKKLPWKKIGAGAACVVGAAACYALGRIGRDSSEEYDIDARPSDYVELDDCGNDSYESTEE